jgi:hypothetical protein
VGGEPVDPEGRPPPPGDDELTREICVPAGGLDRVLS